MRDMSARRVMPPAPVGSASPTTVPEGKAVTTRKRALPAVLQGLAVGALLAMSIAAPFAIARADGLRFVSPEAALEQGISAYRSGVYGIAEKALGYAAQRGSLLGKWYLSRLYADPSSAMTNHARAYELLFAIVQEHAARIDVDDDPRATYVGKALTALAGYWLRGLPEIGIKPNAERAAGYLQEAATYFRNHDAQFELAKLYLTGEGVPLDKRQATHWLSTLSQIGHPGAQAFLADLYWRGKILQRDEGRALALITLAVENAPAQERIWIEDIYQSIYCGMAAGVRRQQEGLIASFRQRYAPRPGTEPQDDLGAPAAPVRACADGTPLPSRRESSASGTAVSRADVPLETTAPRSLQSGMMGVRGTPQR